MFSCNIKLLNLFLALTLLLALPPAADAGNGPSSLPEEAIQNQQGMQHFKHGYYDLMPRGRKAEAGQQMDMAEQSFLKAIDANPAFVEAHRNLGRLYYLQGRFELSARQYSEVVRLDPRDLDSYVQLALAQTGMEDFASAVSSLERAKQHTRDEAIIEKLNTYIEKIRQGQ